jgi:hypothetical protein
VAPNKKIHLTYLWTDESVMHLDFAKKISRSMTEWANEFYQPYGFELDVEPGYNVGTVALANKFALEKNNGVRPDFSRDESIAEEFKKKYEAITKQIDAKDAEIVELRKTYEQSPAGDSAARDRAYAKLMKAYDELSELRDVQRGLYDERDAKLVARHFEYELRMQMMFKFFIDKIGNGSRLNVVFCRFADDPAGRTTTGNTFMTSSATGPILARKYRLYLWPYPFIILNITKWERRAIAHEVVHAAGEFHPPDQKVRTLQKVLEARPVRPPPKSMLDRAIDSYLDYESQFEMVDGAFFDGPHNSIMNYSLQDKEPSDYILEDVDKKRLEQAFFAS